MIAAIYILATLAMFYVMAKVKPSEPTEQEIAEKQARKEMLAKREVIREEMVAYLDESDKAWAAIKAQDAARMAKYAR